MIEFHRKVLLKTNMIDSIIETYPSGKVPKELELKKAEILSQVTFLFIFTEIFSFFLFGKSFIEIFREKN